MARFGFPSLELTHIMKRMCESSFSLFCSLLICFLHYFVHRINKLCDRVPELIFWHIPSQAYKNVAPRFGIHQPCVGLINKESVAPQEAETGIMNLLVKRPSVKVSSQISLL